MQTQLVFFISLFLLGALAAGNSYNDNCDRPSIINGLGQFTFYNEGDTTDGMAFGTRSQCGADGGDSQIYNDLWYIWTANCNGVAEARLCDIDGGRIAVYRPKASCSEISAGDEIACSDTVCNVRQSNDLKVGPTWEVQNGLQYLIRAGMAPGAAPGRAILEIGNVGHCCADTLVDVNYSAYREGRNKLILKVSQTPPRDEKLWLMVPKADGTEETFELTPRGRVRENSKVVRFVFNEALEVEVPETAFKIRLKNQYSVCHQILIE